MNQKTLSRRGFLRASAGVAALVPLGGVLAACASDAPAAGGSGLAPQSFTTTSAYSAAYYWVFLAKDKGFWSNRGLDVTIRAGQGSSTALQAMLGGSVEYSYANPLDTIVAIADQQAPIVSVAQINQRQNFAFGSLSSAPLRDPAQWAGKRIGIVSSGGATEKTLNMILSSVGVDQGSVTRPITGVGAGAAELARTGQVDGWISEINDLRFLAQAGLGVDVLEIDPWVDVPATTIAATTRTVAEQPEEVAAFLGGVKEAVLYAADPANSAEVLSIVKGYATEVPEDKLAFELPIRVELATADGPDSVLKFKPEAWERGQQTMLDLGLITKTVPLTSLYDASIVDSLT
ncbi:ABC transporter substrate-binding protein [Pseudonocardia pini]|uniref:ABC transporter substrate-binding protein n=1 Tax=Pseudonocardia pini TaxID=2758030 RepID=UPI0015F019E2|nr:ABC transporter substrate-binding protein [Pseudonocardia pini]